MRQHIRAETTKVESYHQFTDWIAFGGPVLRSGDPVEQEKRIKYRDLVANAVMLHNVADMTNVLYELRQQGEGVTTEVVRRLSPQPSSKFPLRLWLPKPPLCRGYPPRAGNYFVGCGEIKGFGPTIFTSGFLDGNTAMMFIGSEPTLMNVCGTPAGTFAT
jgi:hypothetical protein